MVSVSQLLTSMCMFVGEWLGGWSWREGTLCSICLYSVWLESKELPSPQFFFLWDPQLSPFCLYSACARRVRDPTKYLLILYNSLFQMYGRRKNLTHNAFTLRNQTRFQILMDKRSPFFSFWFWDLSKLLPSSRTFCSDRIVLYPQQPAY